MSFVETSSTSFIEQNEIKKSVKEAMNQLQNQTDRYIQSKVTLEECYFITDYIFSVFIVDEVFITQINKQLKDKCSVSFQKDDLMNYLSIMCSGSKRRTPSISIDDIIQYIDTRIIKLVEKEQAHLDSQKKKYLSKMEAITFLTHLMDEQGIEIDEVSAEIHKHLDTLYKFVFFDDIIYILLEINKAHNTYEMNNSPKERSHRRSRSNKQNCGCSIF